MQLPPHMTTINIIFIVHQSQVVISIIVKFVVCINLLTENNKSILTCKAHLLNLRYSSDSLMVIIIFCDVLCL